MLPKEFKNKWTTALRSGKYGQCRSTLHIRGKGYCCLGVAAAICGVDDDSMLGTDYLRYNNNGGRLPDDIAAAIPVELTPEMEIKLSKMNDEERKTFHEIADFIEQNY